jgi:putative transposase
MLQRHTRLAFSGSLHFITTVTSVRGNWFIEPDTCRGILELFEGYRKRHDVDCFGYVLMPDHLHALLLQKTDDPVVSKLMEDFKSVSSRKFKPEGYPEKSLWRKRFDDVPIPGYNAAMTRLKYMFVNPIQRELVEKPEDYLWSSARQLYGLCDSVIVTLASI